MVDSKMLQTVSAAPREQCWKVEPRHHDAWTGLLQCKTAALAMTKTGLLKRARRRTSGSLEPFLEERSHGRFGFRIFGRIIVRTVASKVRQSASTAAREQCWKVEPRHHDVRTGLLQ